MDGWTTIKKVREELSEATSQAKYGSKSTAAAAMLQAKRLLDQYVSENSVPNYGFADQPNSDKQKV